MWFKALAPMAGVRPVAAVSFACSPLLESALSSLCQLLLLSGPHGIFPQVWEVLRGLLETHKPRADHYWYDPNSAPELEACWPEAAGLA